jgi:hypothetical protein
VAPFHAVFAEETTVGRISVSSVDDRSFAVTWVTDQPADGFVRYGADPSQPDAWTRVDDVRGPSYRGYTHYVSVENGDPGLVAPGRVYFFSVTSGGTTTALSGQARLMATTGPTLAGPGPTPNFFSGIARYSDGRPAPGVIVLVTLQRIATGGTTEASQPLSGLSDDSGAFSVDVSLARIARAQGAAEYFRLSANSADEKVGYELDAGRATRVTGSVDANATSAGSAAPAQPRLLTLPFLDASTPGLLASTTAVVVPTPPPVAPTVSPAATAVRPSPSPTATRVAPATPSATRLPDAPSPTVEATPAGTPGGSPSAIAGGETPGAAATPTPPAGTGAAGRRVPLAILAVIGAAILLVTTGLALTAVGLVEASRRR